MQKKISWASFPKAYLQMETALLLATRYENHAVGDKCWQTIHAPNLTGWYPKAYSQPEQIFALPHPIRYPSRWNRHLRLARG